MMIQLVLLLAGSLSVFAVYLIIAVLTALSAENELPDLDDIQV